MELKFTDKLLICVLRTFNSMLNDNDYKISSIVYNERDGDSIIYEGYNKRSRNFKIEICYGLGYLNIIISKPKNIIESLKEFLIILSSVMGITHFRKKIISHNLGFKSFDVKDAKLLFNIIDKEDHLNELNYEDITLKNKNFIQEFLIPIIKGEMWIDKLINTKTYK